MKFFKLIIFYCFFISGLNSSGQEIDSCGKAFIKYLECKTRNSCSLHETEAFHKQNIEELLHVINAYKDRLDDEIYLWLGKEYSFLEMYDSAFYYWKISKSLVIYDTTGTLDNNFGTVYFNQGNYEKALDYFFLAYKKNKRNQDYMYNIASCYGTFGDYKKSIQWNMKALKIGKLTSANASSYESLSISYKNLSNMDKYLYYLNLYHSELAKFKEEKINCNCVKPDCFQ